MKNEKDERYRDLYLKYDMLLLAGVFEKFRNKSFKNYGLCPSHYLSAPAFSWEAMLNTRKLELKHIPDSDMYIFFEKGGVSNSFNKYSKANDKHLKSCEQKP